MAKVEIYVQAGCPYCQRAVLLLQRKGVEVQPIDAPKGSPEREEAIKRSGGQTTAPVIFIDGKLIGGCDALQSLDKEGKLDAMLGVK